MRTSAIFASVLLASLIVPTFASAGSTPPNGVCYNDIDCMTGYNCPPAVGFAINRTCLATVAPAQCVTSGTPCTASDGNSGACSPSLICISFVSQIPTGVTCTPTSCNSGYTCTNGTCVQNATSGNTCTPTSCNQGYTCTNGTCVQNSVTSPVTLINPLKSGTSLTSFLNNILDFVIYIGSFVVIFMLVFVGFKFVVAQGAPAKIEEAKKMLLWTIIGALVLLGAKAISAGILATVQSLGG